MPLHHRDRSGAPKDLREAGPAGEVTTYRVDDLSPEDRTRLDALAPATKRDKRRGWAHQIHAAQMGDQSAARRVEHDHPRQPKGGDDEMARGKPLVADVKAFEADFWASELRLEDVAEKWGIDAEQVTTYCHNHGIPLPLHRGEDPEQRRRRDAARAKPVAEAAGPVTVAVLDPGPSQRGLAEAEAYRAEGFGHDATVPDNERPLRLLRSTLESTLTDTRAAIEATEKAYASLPSLRIQEALFASDLAAVTRSLELLRA